MKLFTFYIYVTLALILTSSGIAAIQVIHQFQGPLSDGAPAYTQWTNFMESALQLIVTFGPLSVTLHFRERKWVSNLFVFTAVAGLLFFLTSAPYVSQLFYDFFPYSFGTLFSQVTAVIMVAQIVAFLTGCYATRDPHIRNGFRWVGHTYLFAIIVGIASLIFKILHWSILQSPAIPQLAQIPENIVFLTLLRRIQHIPRVPKHWEAAIASIGTPEN